MTRNGTVALSLRRLVVERDGWQCRYCGRPVRRFQGPECPRNRCGHMITMDHIIPGSAGGRRTLSNLVVCCQDCNDDKKDNPASGKWVLLPVPDNPLRDLQAIHNTRCYCYPKPRRLRYLHRHEIEAMNCGFEVVT